MFLKKRMRVPLIESPIINALFFHILNDNMYMMLSVCCFWIFNKKKRCVKSWVSFFNKNDLFFLTYAWIWIPSGFIKAVNFKIFFFNYNGLHTMTNYPGLVSESCHESTFKLIRPQGLVTILSSSLLICNFNAILHRICILNHVYMSIRAEFIRAIWLVGYF